MHASRFSSPLSSTPPAYIEGPPDPGRHTILRDLGTLFSSANGYMQIALLELAADHPAREALALAGRVLWRAQNVSHGLASVEASGTVRLRLLDLRRVVREAVETASGFASPGIDLHVHAPRDPVSVRGDGAQVMRVVLDAIRHALESMEGARGSRVDVHVQAPTPLEPDTATILVRDDGPGMSAEDVRAARSLPFGRVAHDGRAGLGLWLAEHVAAHHGGRVEVRSAPGAGTEVRVRLPIADDA